MVLVKYILIILLSSFRLHHNDIIDVSGVLTGDVFVLEMPFLVVALHGDADGVMAVLPVDFVDGLGEGCLLFAVHGVEQVALDGFVLADVPHDDAAFLIPETGIVLPLVAE